MKKNNIPYGVYIYSYATSVKQAESEANHVLRLIKGHTLNFPIYYDMEDAVQAKLSKSNRTKIANKFLGIIKNAGYECGIYANLNWWNNYLDSTLAVIIHGEHGLHSTIIMAVITRETTVCGRAHLQLR